MKETQIDAAAKACNTQTDIELLVKLLQRENGVEQRVAREMIDLARNETGTVFR